MSDRHLPFWPHRVPRHLTVPETNLFYNAEVSAERYPNKPFLVFYDSLITFGDFRREAERLAGHLQQVCGVKAGDRVLLYMQNSPQFVIGYYAVLRANAVVVPVNPMNMTAELRHYTRDSGARTALVAQELYPRIRPLLGAEGDDALDHVVVGTYSDYLTAPTDLIVPEVFAAAREPVSDPGAVSWFDALGAARQPGPLTAGPDDLCVMPYTSGTTGQPKGCMHTHRTTMTTVAAMESWFGVRADDVRLAALPFFHVTGMQGGMSGPLLTGSTLVLLPRWDRDTAAAFIQRYRIGSWTATPTMVIDFLSNPALDDFDIASLWRINSGGAAMPQAIAQQLRDRNISIVEGYGLTETIAPTHVNPPERAKLQCLGIPLFGVDARVVDPATLKELPPGEVGEIITHGPQVFLGYWNHPEADANVFVEIEGKRFFRTGDLGRTDEEGYFFMVDRLKRMINASGYKVWPAEVETLLFGHPAVLEACVVGVSDPHRGETVKAFVVLREQFRDTTSAQDIIDWSRQNMSAYKVPRIVEFVSSLPKSGTGKMNWRALQEREAAKAG